MKFKFLKLSTIALLCINLPLIHAQDKIQAFRDTLNALYQRTDNDLFKSHCQSILATIESDNMNFLEQSYIEDLYDCFTNNTDPYSPAHLNTYLERRRPFVLTWTSPSDGSMSLSWLKPPRNYIPGQKYPLYVELHGLWSVASNFYQYMTYPFLQGVSYNNAFEDGFLLSPWGRGNYWYQGSSETDIWECVAALEKMVEIDSTRKYLCGHSMGGYGAYCIAARSPGIWAALGIYAGALGYYPSPVTKSVATTLKEVPVYFICGTQDNLLAINQEAFRLLQQAGNQNLFFGTFEGGHEYRSGDVFAMYMWMRKFVNNNVTTDINEFHAKASEGFKIMSITNPVKGNMIVEYSGSNKELPDVSIYDSCGRAVRMKHNPEQPESEQRLYIDLSYLSPGLYILRLQDYKGAAAAKVFRKL